MPDTKHPGVGRPKGSLAPTSRMFRASRLFFEGKADSRGKAMRMAGYAESSSRIPLSYERMLDLYRQQTGETVSDLAPSAVKRLRSVIADPNHPHATQAAGMILKLVSDEKAAGTGDDLTPENEFHAKGRILRAFRLGAYWASRVARGEPGVWPVGLAKIMTRGAA